LFAWDAGTRTNGLPYVVQSCSPIGLVGANHSTVGHIHALTHTTKNLPAGSLTNAALVRSTPHSAVIVLFAMVVLIGPARRDKNGQKQAKK
jgi:hypothetical protein